jgi:hypothetical protein
MLTEEDDVEIHPLAKRGWSISAIARHTGRDRKTVRAYLRGKQHKRKRPPSCLEPYRDYLVARFADDHHVLATVLYRELIGLGFDRSYQTLVRELHRLEAQAQADLDRFCATIADERRRPGGTVGSVADAEPLVSLPASPFPAELEAERVVDAKALVNFEGNHYSVPPELLGQVVRVRARLGELEVAIVSAAGQRVARHRRAPAGAAQTISDTEHAQALERVVLDSFTSSPPCKRKANRPPGEAAWAAAARIRGKEGKEVAIDLHRYAEIARAAR